MKAPAGNFELLLNGSAGLVFGCLGKLRWYHRNIAANLRRGANGWQMPGMNGIEATSLLKPTFSRH